MTQARINHERQTAQATALLAIRTVAAQTANLQQIAEQIQQDGMTRDNYLAAKRATERLWDQLDDAEAALVEAAPRQDPAWLKRMENGSD